MRALTLTIGQKFAAALFIATLAPIAYFGYHDFVEARRQLTDAKLKELYVNCISRARVLEQTFVTIRADLRYLRTTQSLLFLMDASVEKPAASLYLRGLVEQEFHRFLTLKPQYAKVGLIDAMGDEVIVIFRSGDALISLTEEELRNRLTSPAFVAAGFGSDSGVAAIPLRDAADPNRPLSDVALLRYAATLFDRQGKARYLLYVDMNGADVDQSLRRQTFDLRREASLITRDGRFLYDATAKADAPPPLTGTPPSVQDRFTHLITSQLLSGRPGVIADAPKALYAYAPVYPRLGDTTLFYVLFDRYDVAKIDAALSPLRSRYLFGGVAALMLALFLALVVAGALTRNLKRLQEGVGLFAARHMGHRITIRSGDEVEQLAATYNSMADSLRDYHEQMEGKVAERARQIRTVEGRLTHAEKLAAIGFLAAGMAHEVNNPIAIIVTRLELMRRELERGNLTALEKDIDVVERHAARIGEIAGGLLTFARDVREEANLIDCNRVISRMTDLIAHPLEKKGIALEVDLDADLPRAWISEKGLEQTLYNLLYNAWQALASGDRIRVSSCLSEEGAVVIVVSDNGPGIAPDDVPRVFDPFFTTKAPGEGTGLGLSISYGLMKDCGGSLTVASKVDEGALFTISLSTADVTSSAVTRTEAQNHA